MLTSQRQCQRICMNPTLLEDGWHDKHRSKPFLSQVGNNPSVKPICQRRRKMALELLEEIERQVKELQETGFIREIRYMTWLANVVSLSKNIMKNGECALTTSIWTSIAQNTHLVLYIDKLVDGSSSYQYLSFMDAYLGYNQIPLHPDDEEKTTFMTKKANYCYKRISFGLKKC